MNANYKIRKALVSDKVQIQSLFRESVARRKKIIHASLIDAGYLEEFVDKVIALGNMLVVENGDHELALIGEIHDYSTLGSPSGGFKELSFVSGPAFGQSERETALVNWLFREIQRHYREVFRVEVTTPIRNQAAVDFYKKLGLTLGGNYSGRLKNTSSGSYPMIPLSWINPPFN